MKHEPSVVYIHSHSVLSFPHGVYLEWSFSGARQLENTTFLECLHYVGLSKFAQHVRWLHL